MKYKAIATIVLLLLPMLGVPIALSNQPPPQTWNVEFKVLPTESKFYGPCVVSTAFPIDVYMWNDKSLTGTSVYAYDFYLWWTDAGISLTSWTVNIPTPWVGHSYVVKNESGVSGVWSFYHLAVTAVGNTSDLYLGSSALFNASLVTLHFHIDSEPCWPNVNHTYFLIGNENGAYQDPTTPLSPPNNLLDGYKPHVTQCTNIIDNIELENGEYWLYSSQPNIDPLVAPTDPGYVTDHIFKENSIGETHTIIIALSNITGAYGFDFTLHWDSAWYTFSIQKVTILPGFAPPYEELDMTNGSDAFHIRLIRPCEKPGIHAAGYTPVVSIDFVTTNTPMVGQIPVATNTTFSLTTGALYAKCNGQVTPYYLSTGHGSGDLWYSGDIIQMFVPKSPADLNIDGAVNIKDLDAIAAVYGKTPASPYTFFAAPTDVPVDIFDIVYVAKRQGDP